MAEISSSSDDIPDIRRRPKDWFEFFNRNKDGLLLQEELIFGLQKSFESYDFEAFESFVEGLWPGQFLL